jgi:hypothetical protein
VIRVEQHDHDPHTNAVTSQSGHSHDQNHAAVTSQSSHGHTDGRNHAGVTSQSSHGHDQNHASVTSQSSHGHTDTHVRGQNHEALTVTSQQGHVVSQNVQGTSQGQHVATVSQAVDVSLHDRVSSVLRSLGLGVPLQEHYVDATSQYTIDVLVNGTICVQVSNARACNDLPRPAVLTLSL